MSLTVSIFAKKDYIAKDGCVPIYLGITVSGVSRPPINLKQRVNPSFWNEEAEPHQVKKGFPNYDHINTALLDALSKGRKIIRKYEALEKVLTYERFMKEWGGFNPYDFDQLVAEYIHRLKSARHVKTKKPMYSESYVSKVGWVMGKVTNWRPNLDLQDIDYKLIMDYWMHLATLGNCENTIYSNLRIFRRVVKDAYDQELIARNPFDKVKLRKPKVVKTPLELEEVKQYEELLQGDLPMYLHKTLCWFLLAVYTGRRFGDLENFNEWEISNDYIRLIQDKTVAGIQERKVIMIFMNDRIRQIISLIRHHKYTLPKNGHANRWLKELTDLANVKKKSTFHLARHSFNNINKKLRTDPFTRRELLGHDSFRSTQVYEKPDPEQLQEAMLKWNNA